MEISTKAARKSKFLEALSHFEANIAENKTKATVTAPEASGTSRAHRSSANKQKSLSTKDTNARKEVGKENTPVTKKKGYGTHKPTAKKTKAHKSNAESAGSLTSATESESLGSSEFKILSPKLQTKPKVKGRRLSLHEGNLIGIPESATFRGDESLSLELVLSFEDGFHSPQQRRLSMAGSQTSWDEDSSRSSIISRTSPKIRSLPRDVDFDSSESSSESDSTQKARKLKGTRFW